MLRRLLVCLAFATCCFLNTWVELAEGESIFFARYDPLHAVVTPVVCWEIVLTLGMFGVWECCRRRSLERWLPVHMLFLACCFVPLGIASLAALRLSPFNLTPVIRNPLFWPMLFVAALVPFCFIAFRIHAVSRLVRRIFLYSWPVLALVLIQAVRQSLLPYPPAAYTDGALAPSLQSQARRIRVVWIIFDELSQSITFENRPGELPLPNLDRLKAESFYATSAKAPGPSTEVSMPALILGEQVTEAIPKGPDNLLLRTASRPEPFAWSSVPNVFDTARDLGFNTGLVGWYHPYGRLLNRSLTKCYWTAGWLLPGVEERSEPQPLVRAMWYRANLQFAVLPLMGHMPFVFPGIHHRREKSKRFSYLLDRAREMAANPAIGLALLHLPVPHPPAIYDRRKGVMSADGSIGYLDSVALADRTLGALRQEMERAGLWDHTAVLVSADHGWRTYLWRGGPEWTAEEEAASRNDTSGVPFILKLPGQTSEVAYNKSFGTVITRQIITDILSGRLTDPAMIQNAIQAKQARY
jgi:hypothetical protein